MSLLSAIDDAIAETEAHMMAEVIAAPAMACSFDKWHVQSLFIPAQPEYLERLAVAQSVSQSLDLPDFPGKC
jgi:hypothetical protein